MFRDRRDAGRQLAERLLRYRGPDTVVLGLPRGGVPVAAEVAHALGAPLDVIVVRKLGVPHQPELAMGAVGEGDVIVVNHDVVRHLGLSDEELAEAAARERAVVAERAERFRPRHPGLALEGKRAVIVDDGIATGSTAHAACAVARAAGAAVVVLAVPVAPADTRPETWPEVDEFVCLQRPHRFYAVGQFYQHFDQTTDDEVSALLERAAAAVEPPPAGDMSSTTRVNGLGSERPAVNENVEIPVGADILLPGYAVVPSTAGPATARGVVLFAHGSGSGRNSPRNRYVAEVLQDGRLGTLLFDLLTPAEEAHRANVFNISLLATRLEGATDWVVGQPWAARLPVAYFGASTGAAAALVAAAARGEQVAAVVSRGGRPDLAIPVLDRVTAPTLLIVGGDDETVLGLNREAQRHLRCENRLAVVPGATHLFEEPGTLEQAATLARDWFLSHVSGTRAG